MMTWTMPCPRRTSTGDNYPYTDVVYINFRHGVKVNRDINPSASSRRPGNIAKILLTTFALCRLSV